MQTIILSAGKSSRFGVDGFPYQKCMLPMPDGRTLLEWQVDYLRPEKLLYISRSEYRRQEESLIKKIRLMKPNVTAVWLNQPTRGALGGLWAAKNYISMDEELLIAYNDELVAPEELDEMVSKCRRSNYRAAIVAFITDNPRFTVVPNTDLFAGCTYYFANGEEFIAKVRTNDKDAENGVPDIVYRFKHRLYYQVHPDKIAELGTAREYKFWMGKQGKPVEEW